MASQSGELLPGLACIGRAKERRVLHPGVDGVGVGQRWFKMPDPLELPGVRGAVVPLVRAGVAVVLELVAHRLPGLAAVVGAMHHLTEPVAHLGSVDPTWIDRRPLQVVELQSPKLRFADRPLLALAIRCQDERALVRTHQNPHPAHLFLLPESPDRLPGSISPIWTILPGISVNDLGDFTRIGRNPVGRIVARDDPYGPAIHLPQEGTIAPLQLS